ncbi:hypothetical protein ACFV9C_02440 [Kribbella sp. NPDC059898]|uniref:AAA family ATPase n=1 Tax=Kribbella sp. NPDC059898 TaxID=3346995 RepID=UPI00365560D1
MHSIGGTMAISPLVLTGGPAVGKSATGRALAEGHPRCAYVDVDDIRQLVVSGAAAPWDDDEGLEQQRLGVVNACGIARNFLAAGIDVVIADVLTPETSELYKQNLPGCVIVHLRVGLPEALRRAASREAWLTDTEFRMLHAQNASNPPYADHHIQVDTLDLPHQIAVVAALWSEGHGG